MPRTAALMQFVEWVKGKIKEIALKTYGNLSMGKKVPDRKAIGIIMNELKSPCC